MLYRALRGLPQDRVFAVHLDNPLLRRMSGSESVELGGFLNFFEGFNAVTCENALGNFCIYFGFPCALVAGDFYVFQIVRHWRECNRKHAMCHTKVRPSKAKEGRTFTCRYGSVVVELSAGI